MNEYELRWIIKDKSMHKDENTERQKDTTPEYQWTKMNEYEEKKWTIKDQLGQTDKAERYEDKKNWWIGLRKHPDDLQLTP